MCRLIHAFASILFLIFTSTVGLVKVASTGEEWVLTTVKPPNPLERAPELKTKLGAAEQRAIDAEQKLGAAEQRAIDAEQKLGAAEQRAVTAEQSIRAEAKHEISIANQRHRNDIDRLNIERGRLALNLEQKMSELEAYKGMCQQAEMEKQRQQIQISTLQGEKEELSKRVEEVMLQVNTEIQKAEVQHAARAESISEELETEKQQRESLEEQLEQAKLHIGTLQTEKEEQNKEVQLRIITEVQQAELQHTAHVESLSEELETEKQLRESFELELKKARFFESMYSAEVDALREEKMEHIAIQGILHISCCLQIKQIIVVVSCRLSPWSGCDSTDQHHHQSW